MPSASEEDSEYQDDIARRWKEYQDNPFGLPDIAPPGSKPRESRKGHLRIINDLEKYLQELEKKYSEQCGGGSSSCSEPETSGSNMSTAAKIGAGAAVIGACVAAPELCIPSAIIGGAVAQ